MRTIAAGGRGDSRAATAGQVQRALLFRLRQHKFSKEGSMRPLTPRCWSPRSCPVCRRMLDRELQVFECVLTVHTPRDIRPSQSKWAIPTGLASEPATCVFCPQLVRAIYSPAHAWKSEGYSWRAPSPGRTAEMDARSVPKQTYMQQVVSEYGLIFLLASWRWHLLRARLSLLS